MQTTRVGARRYLWRTCAALLAMAVAGPAFAQGGVTNKGGTVERVTVHGASLVGNLEGDSPDRDVFIYLPPSYASNRTQRYPVVYLLHGYGLTAERWMPFAGIAAAADKNIAAGTMRELILVNPDAYTVHGGSMYSASATVGDWETFIAEDLVAYVDTNYRTLATRMSRGLAGHSMGGYGTLRIGMKRADVFSAMYPMSSCCLIDAAITGAGRGRGAAAAPPAGRAGATPPANAGTQAGARGDGARGDGARGRAAGAGAGARGRGGFGNVQLATAAAWAPNPKNPPNYADLPVVDGEPQPLVIAKFAANSPFAMLPQYVTNLKKYTAIMLDVGDQDGLAGSNRQLVQSLADFGVTHTFEVYEGDHTNRVPQRIETAVLPFFSKALSFSAPR
jgi:enterochelin esterase-like enzyme